MSDVAERAAEDPRRQQQLVPRGPVHGAVEALLLMATEPVAAIDLAQVLEVPVEEVSTALAELAAFYDETGRGFELRHIAGGWRYWTRSDHAGVITRSVLAGQQSRLSQAALETLAVVAYLQPVSRSRVSAVRGVGVDGVIRTLLAREMIEEAGADEQSGAVLFRTTEVFLEKLGLQSLEELPELAPHLPDATDLESELGRLAERDQQQHLPADGVGADHDGSNENDSNENDDESVMDEKGSSSDA